jgi:hypothetical protein
MTKIKIHHYKSCLVQGGLLSVEGISEAIPLHIFTAFGSAATSTRPDIILDSYLL